MQITFTAVIKPSKNPKEVSLPEDTPKEYLGTFTVRVLTAQEGIEAIDELIASNDEYKENPESIKVTEYRMKLLEKATTKDGKSLTKINMKTIPNKLYSLLIAANERLNGLTDSESRFLLEPSSANNEHNIQP